MLSKSAKELISRDIVFSEEARLKVRKPLGKLIEGEPPQTVARLKQILKLRKPAMLVCVGDVSSKTLVLYGVKADIYVVDGKVARKEAAPFSAPQATVLHTVNPAGTLAAEASKAIQDAIDHEKPVIVRVKGEEDLLTLAAIMSAPLGSAVVYGQPYEGLVVVDVTTEKRKEIWSLLSELIGRCPSR